VDATPGVTHADLHAFQRAPRSAASRTSAKRSASLNLQEKIDAEAWMPPGRRRRGQGRCLQEEGASGGRAVAGAGRWLAGLRPEREGRSRCHRHHRPQRRGRDSSRLLREAEAKALRTLESCAKVSAAKAKPRTTRRGRRRAPKAAAMSDRLAQRLSAHRTAALQIEVARHPQVALAALVHGMVQTVLQGRTTATTCRWA
jgi:ParB family chromosome partitioning protein